MTFDQGISTTWGRAMIELRDKVSGMTGWSIVDDKAGTGTDSQGNQVMGHGDKREFFVLETPEGEHIRICWGEAYLNGDGSKPRGGTNDRGSHAIWIEHGYTWDPTGNASADGNDFNDGVWLDRFGGDFQHVLRRRDGEERSSYLFGPCDHGNNLNDLQPLDSVEYSMDYSANEGFVMHVKRTAGDGSDGEFILGAAKLSQFYDYTADGSRESLYALCIGGAYTSEDNNNNQNRGTGFYNNWMSGGGGNGLNRTAVRSSTNFSDYDGGTEAFGLPNQNPNANDYPALNENLVASPKWTNGDSASILGTHELWIVDMGGSSHGDVIEDDTGTPKYTIMANGANFSPIGLAMY